MRGAPPVGMRRSIRAAMAVALLFASHQEAMAGRLGRFGEFAAIGFSAHLIARYIEDDTCKDAQERNAGAAAAGIVGSVAGGIFGALMATGDDGNVGDTIMGGIVGTAIGRMAGQTLGDTITSVDAGGAGNLAEMSVRDFTDAFNFRVCEILGASDKIRAPLLAKYINTAPPECLTQNVPTDRFTWAQWNEFISCNNNRVGEAREVTLSMIELNIAVCRSITELYTAMADQAQPVPALRSFVGSADPGCVQSRVSDAWGGFVEGRE